MKKYLIAFILFPILMFGQSTEKNYTKTTVFNNETTVSGTGFVYDNYTQIIDLTTNNAQEFFTDYGTGFVSITILNDVLTVEFNSNFNSYGQVQVDTQTSPILSNLPLPNMVLGDLDCGTGYPDLIKVSILNNMLNLQQNYNYTSVNSFHEVFTVNLSANAGTVLPNANIENITYFDGLGRPIQQVGIKQSPTSKNIVQHIEYDQFGRQSKTYLPYASQYGNPYFETSLPSKINTYYTDHFSDTNPFSEKTYEKSPIDRIMEQGAPGASWQVVNGSDADHTVKFDYQYNSTSDKVRIFGVSIHPTTAVVSLVDTGLFYPQDKLYKTIIKDENWQPTQTNLVDNTVAEFKDKLGHIILKRAYNQAKWHDTYYVYDDYGNLTYVLPPQLNTYPSNQQIWPDQSFGFEGLESFYATSFPDAISNEGNVSLYNNNFYFYFEQYGAIPGVALNTTGVVVDLNFSPPLPDMDLGNVTITKFDGSTCSTCYTAYLQNGDIRIRANGTIVPAYSAYFEENVDMNTITAGLGGMVGTTALNDFAYQYKYDTQNRVVEKTLPGKQVEYIVYDKLDRPILTQDGELRSNNKWLFVKYDAFNRLCYSGVWTNPVANQSRELVQNSVDTQFIPVWLESKMATPLNIGTPSSTVYYSNSAFPKTNLEVLAINYYDNYTFDNAGLVTAPSFGIMPSTSVRSLTTGTKTKVLGTNDWITNLSFYDDKGRPIYNASYNAYLGTTNKVKMKLDFIGKILETESVHVKSIVPTMTVTVIDKFTYDPIGRLLTQKQVIDSQQEQLICKNTYNELGNLISKNVGGKTAITGDQGLQKVDFNYNIRGWLKDINEISHLSNDLFAINFNYQDTSNSPYTTANGPGTPLYNSNICASTWRTDNSSSSVKSYYNNYDNLNRLKSAYYAENSLVNNKYLEMVSQYDRNGNILGLNRYTQSSTNPIYNEGIDYLTYTYSGNKLMSVKDMYGLSTNGIKGFKDNNTVGDDYDYNFNGNIKFDKNKGITLIEYNHLNLPTKIVFNNADTGSANPKVIEYKYDAAGIKIEKKVREPILVGSVFQNTIKVIQYDGNAEYKDDVLQFFSQTEGYVTYNSAAPVNSKFTYVFQYKDQVGNVRVSYKDNNDDGVITGASTELFYEGFEANSGWESLGDPMHYGGAVAYDTTKKHSGSASGKIVKTTAGELYVQSNTWVPISNTAPTDYIISGWIYSDNPSVDIFLFENKAGETGYNTRFDNMSSIYEKNRWVYIEKRITVLPDIVKLALRIDNNGGGTVWFDDVSIRKVNDPTTIEIVEENNFYPFGLKHKGYNNIIAGFGNPLAQQFGFQGQEIQEELGLGWNSFKWRNYDPETGRFMSVDPFAEKYSYNSTYAFQENKMGMGRELEGLELYNSNGTLNETNANNALGGLKNVIFGTVGCISTGAVIVGTDGLAAIPLGTAFMLSCAEVGIGIGQIGDALGNNSGHTSLQKSSSLFGIIAYESDSEDAELWDAAGAVLPALLSANTTSLGTYFMDVTGLSAANDFRTATKNIPMVLDFFETWDAYEDDKAFGEAVWESAKPVLEAISPMSPAGIVPSVAPIIYANFTISYTINPLPTNLPAAAPSQQMQLNFPIIENGFED